MSAPVEVTVIDKASKAIINYEWAKQNQSKTRWMVIELVQGGGILGSVKYTAKVFENSGVLVSTTLIGTDTATTFKKYNKEAVQKLKDFTTQSADDESSAGYNLDTPLNEKALSNVRYNPIPHRATRSSSFFVNANIENQFKKQASLSKSRYGDTLKLGRVYQTEATALALQKRKLIQNSNASSHVNDLNLQSVRAGTGVWGFRFIYNPTTIQYSNQVDSSIDWVLNQQDPSRFFGGNVSVSFDLYLNRIADLSTITSPTMASAALSQSYPGSVPTPEDIEGLYYRGTEYDLEYLYRCVNGDPQITTLTTKNLQTADFGYVTGSPLWLQLHDGMRFKVSLVSMSVTHVSFSERLVPMLSVVNLSFLRYPEFKAFGDNEDAIRSQLTSQFDSSGQPTPGKTGK